jgi:spermidine/putrescine-binding protein
LARASVAGLSNEACIKNSLDHLFYLPENRLMTLRLLFFFLPALLLFAPGCGPQPESSSPRVLNLYIWSDYISRETLSRFTAKTGIKVNFDTYDSNEALLQKLQSGVANYDVVVPSDYMVRILIAEGLVTPLDKSLVKGMENLAPRFLNQKFDPENRHSIPYLWGTTGLAYNKLKVNLPQSGDESWDLLCEKKYAGRILMLDDVRECFAVALKSKGHSINTTDPQILRDAAKLLKQQKPWVKAYNSGDYANILASGDVDLSHGYNGQFAKIISSEPEKFAYFIPKEGGTLWMDNLCIPAKAPHKSAAYAFLNYLLEPQTAAEIVNFVNYASANEAAKALIKPEIVNDPIIYPGDEEIANCEFLEDVGPAAPLLDELWTEIKNQ